MRSPDQDIEEFEKKYARLKASDPFEADPEYYHQLAQRIHEGSVRNSGSSYIIQWKHVWMALPVLSVIILLFLYVIPGETIPEISENQYASHDHLEEWIVHIEESIITEVVLDLSMEANISGKMADEKQAQDLEVQVDTLLDGYKLTEEEILEYLTREDILLLN